MLFAAFTGKAAQVMRNKGCANARTIHSLIYRPRGEKPEKETGELQPTFALNRMSPVSRAKLVVIDEGSMVDEKLGRDLLSSARRCWCSAIRPTASVECREGSGGGFSPTTPGRDAGKCTGRRWTIRSSRSPRKVREGGRPDHGSYGSSRVIGRDEIDADTCSPPTRCWSPEPHAAGLQPPHPRAEGFFRSLPAAGDSSSLLRNSSEEDC